MAIQIYSQKNNAWRDAYNPLRGMGLPKLLSLLDAGERGHYANLQWFYHYMERTDAMVFSVIATYVVSATGRMLTVTNCPWMFSGEKVWIGPSSGGTNGVVLVGETSN